MILKGTKTEEISVDATKIQEQINELSVKIDNLPSYSFDDTEINEKLNDLSTKISNVSTDSFDDTELKGKITDLDNKLQSFIKFDMSSDSNFNETIGNLQKELKSLKEQINSIEKQPSQSPLPVSSNDNKFEFVLEKDNDGFSDTSWEEIIKKGQEIQYEYWKKAEEVWNKKFKMYEGWHGSAMSPVIKIICEEPEYLFKNTVRLPGRFCLSSRSRWSSVLRFYTIGDKILKDDTGYGYKWNAPVCIYVEGKTYTKMDDGGTMVMKPFEQTIEEVIICPMTKGIPVYLCENQDRLSIRNCKILSHGGAQIGIRHGPKLAEDKYPWEGVTQSKKNDYNVWLTDPRFDNLQMEGPHNNKRPQAAMAMSGANIIISNLNLYGWMQGPYLYGGINRVINGLTQHWGNTSDGRMYCARDELVSYTVSYTDDTKGTDAFSCIAGDFKKWYLKKGSRAPERGGWHNYNEPIL